MDFYGFHELEEHQELHRQFTNENQKLEKSRLVRESTTNLKTVLGMMQDWFLSHIIVEDRKPAFYL